MRLFERTRSKWWLLLLVAACVLASPLVLIGFFAANNLAGAILGPPGIWEGPWHRVPRNDVIGRYIETQRHWDRSDFATRATLELHEDGTMRVDSLPEDSITSVCLLSGSGSWSGPDSDNKIDLDLAVAAKQSGVCERGLYSFGEVTGHTKPYGIYWVMGDPDSGTGIRFKRE